jgi:hypothetical protein
VNLLVDLQVLWTKFVEVAHNTHLVDTVLSGTEIGAKQFASIGPLADSIVGNLSGMISLLRPHANYATVPLYLFELLRIKPKALPSAAGAGGSGTPATPAKRQQEQHKGAGSDGKTPKADKESSPGTNKDKTPKPPPADLGLIEFIKDAPETPPAFTFAIAHPSKQGASEYPCPPFAFKGFKCNRKKCSLIHSPWRKLSAPDQQQFVAYVEANKAIMKFVQGSGPSGTP